MSTIAAPPTSPVDQRALARRVRRALLAKERRELRPALWAGLTIFVALPTLWSVLLILLDPQHHALPGIPTLMGLFGGGIFAAIIAAQTVCRDFGRAPGVFLAGLPVTRSQIIEAKVAASFRLILLLIALVWVLELIQMPIGQRIFFAQNPFQYGPLAVYLPLCTWLLAFLAAAITRNTLTAVVIAIICLVLLAAIPVVSTWASAFGLSIFVGDLPRNLLGRWVFGRLDPVGWAQSAFAHCIVTVLLAAATVLLIARIGFIRDRLRAPAERRPMSFAQQFLLLALFLFLIGPAGESFWGFALFAILAFLAPIITELLTQFALRSERGWKVSARALVTCVALLILALFLLAMREVGASGRIAFTHWSRGLESISAGSQLVAWNRGFGFELLSREPGPGFAITRQAVLPVPSWSVATRTLLDEHDRCFVLRFHYAQHVPPPGGRGVFETPETPPESVFVTIDPSLDLLRIDTATGVISQPQSLLIPTRTEQQSSFVWFDATIADGALFVLLAAPTPNRRNDPAHPYQSPRTVLLKYALSDSAPLTPSATWEVDTDGTAVGSLYFHSPHWYFARGCDGRSYLVRTGRAPFDVLAPDQDPRGELRFHPQTDEDWLSYQVSNFPVSQGVCAVSSRDGLKLIAEGAPGDTQRDLRRKPARLIGEFRASPWAWLFRAEYPNLLAGHQHQLWEIHEKSAICYDVSDPAHPRRILHVQTPSIDDAVSGPDFLILVHSVGFSIVHHPPAATPPRSEK